MRKVLAVGVISVVAVLGTPVGTFAAAANAPATPHGQQTGNLEGVAKDAAQKELPKVKVQVRGANGQIAATGTTNASGEFSIALNPGTYTIEIVDAAGNIVGTSASIAVTAGAAATVTVTAAAAGAIAAAAGGGLSLFGLGTIGTVAVVGGAAVTTIAAVVAKKSTASPSR